MILTLGWLFISLLGLVFGVVMSLRSSNHRNTLKQASESLKTQIKVFKQYEAINSAPPAPKAVVVKRLRKLADNSNALSDVSSSK